MIKLIRLPAKFLSGMSLASHAQVHTQHLVYLIKILSSMSIALHNNYLKFSKMEECFVIVAPSVIQNKDFSTSLKERKL